MIIICLFCGKKEEHEARGLSHKCYAFVKSRGMLYLFPATGRRVKAQPKSRTEYWRSYKSRGRPAKNTKNRVQNIREYWREYKRVYRKRAKEKALENQIH